MKKSAGFFRLCRVIHNSLAAELDNRRFQESMIPTRIFDYSIGFASFFAALAVGYSYSVQFTPEGLQDFLF